MPEILRQTEPLTKIGIFPHHPQDVTDHPLFALAMEIPNTFLHEEISFGRTIGDSFHISDLANMWCDVVFVKALMKHPEAIRPLKEAAKRRNVAIKPISLRSFMSLLDVTDNYLWENNVDTVEDLITKIVKNEADMPDEVVQYDLDNAFRSFYGVSLLAIA